MGAPDAATPAVKLNAPADANSKEGGRRPCAGVTCEKISPEVMVPVWELYISFVANNPGTARESMIMPEVMPLQIQPGRPDGEKSGVYPLRAYDCHGMAFVNYNDPAVDKAPEEYRLQFRKIFGGAD